MTFVFPGKVQYILNIPKASVKDSGFYECAVTNLLTRQTKSVNLGIAVHGMCLAVSTFTLLCFNHYNQLEKNVTHRTDVVDNQSLFLILDFFLGFR